MRWGECARVCGRAPDIKIFAVDDFTVPCDLYVIYNEERIGENGKLFVDCLKESISSLE